MLLYEQRSFNYDLFGGKFMHPVVDPGRVKRAIESGLR